MPVDLDLSKLEVRTKPGVVGGKEIRREAGCVRCLRRKVFSTVTVGKGRRRKWATLKDPTGARAHLHQASGLCDSQKHSAVRGLERQRVELLLSQNFAGSVRWKTK